MLFGSTAFDSFKDSTRWVKFIQGDSCDVDVTVQQQPGSARLLLGVGAGLPARHDADRRRSRPAAPAAARASSRHSIVPIVDRLHHRPLPDLLLEVGEQTLDPAQRPVQQRQQLCSAPANWQVPYCFSYHPTSLATLKVLAVVLGHVVGVIAAHDRAIQLLPKKHQLTGQLPLLVAMICFTAGGLYLLFAA